LLVIEDDRQLCDVLRRGLTEQGQVVDVCYDGEEGLATGQSGVYDAWIVDLQLPRRDGLSVINALRASGNHVPVLILTSRDTIEDVVAGLDAGADDYLRKPFVFAELEARLRSITRRRADRPPALQLKVADLTFDLATREAHRNGEALPLTSREAAFLEYLMQNSGRVVTRRMLEDAMFDRDSEVTSNVVDVYVSRIRAKLGSRGGQQLLHTIRGVGYRLSER